MISVTCCRMGIFASSLTVPHLLPQLQVLASSKLSRVLLQRISVLIAADADVGVNSGVTPLTMLMFITLAPRFNKATVESARIVVVFVAVLQRKSVDVDDRRRLSGQREHVGVVEYLVPSSPRPAERPSAASHRLRRVSDNQH